MKKMAKVCAVLMAVAMSMGIVGCGGGGGRGQNNTNTKMTTIEFCNFLGCSGDSWIKEAAARFSELKKSESYEDGKTGVEIKVTQEKQIPYDMVDQSGYDIFVGENKVDAYSMSKKNFLLNLNDVVEPIESKISENVLDGLKGVNGNYYALPHYTWYSGISYDVGYFEDENLFFAAPESQSVREVKNEFGTAKFVNNPLLSVKSCGPDGESGTSDDGLPSSLQEFLILCEEISTKAGRFPFEMAGGCIDYAFFLADGLWAALAGPAQIKTIYSLDSDGEMVDLVKLDDDGNIVYTNEVYFTLSNGEKIMKPAVVQAPITEETGYRIYDMESRYYSLAFLKIALDKGWFHDDFNNSGISNIKAQENFLTQQNTAMLYDASYWYTETEAMGNVDKYTSLYPDAGEPKVSYMPLPTQIYGQVTEGNGDTQALLDIGSAQIFVNKRVESSEGKKRAVIEFLQFLYSDSELAKFTETTGLVRPIDYDYDDSGLSYYTKKLNKIVAESEEIYFSSKSEIFMNNKASFSLTWSGAINTVQVGTTPVDDGYLAAMRDYGASVDVTFNSTRKTEASWRPYLSYIK